MSNTISQLKERYEKAKRNVQDYAQENLIFDVNDGDETYIQLLITKLEAYKDLQQAKSPEFVFKKYHAPVINHRIQSLKERLVSLQLRGDSV